MPEQKEKLIFLVKKLILKRIGSFADLAKEKQKICSELKMPLPRNSDILETYQKLKKEKKARINEFLEKKLKKRPIRSLSGVAVVAVLTKPWPCPGRCLYCPLEKGIPKSYLSGEPAVERAKALDFNPFLQVKRRIEMLEKGGHPADKIELIVIGGTWSFLPKKYQTWFIKRCFDAANNLTCKNLSQAQKINEKAKHRIIGLTLETRPDYIDLKEILRMRKLGCTRVEMGVQITDNRILKQNKRGHTIKEIIQATKILKNTGFKICYHLMPNLPGSSPQNDFKMFKNIFNNPDFQPDIIKIYPCVVTKGSKLYSLWKKGKYQPYTEKQLINLLIKMKSIIPPYVRVNRLIRDIPAWQIQGGSKISNLRELVQKKMKKQNLFCQCIRCREMKDLKFKIAKAQLIRREYDTSEGKEIFFSFENREKNKLAAFLRLRLPDHPIKIRSLQGLRDAAIIRELHTYGQSVEVGKKNKTAVQHSGFGKKLMEQAEKIAREKGYKKIAVISGIGVREYYRHLGYHLQNTYMVKSL